MNTAQIRGIREMHQNMTPTNKKINTNQGDKKMKRAEIEKILEDYDYTIHGGAYAVLENDDIVGDHWELVEDMRIATSAHGECVVCLDEKLEDEEDAASVLAYCDLYAGQ